MSRYQIWDGVSDIYTPSGDKFTAVEWKERFPWVKIPGAKMIITSGIINGGAAMEYEQTKDVYKKQGVEITDDMTPDEVLKAIEDFENKPIEVDDGPSVQERTAAALEFIAMNQLPDEQI